VIKVRGQIYSAAKGSILNGRYQESELALDALQMALDQRRPKGGVLHHTDRGVQYACGDYRKLRVKPFGNLTEGGTIAPNPILTLSLCIAGSVTCFWHACSDRREISKSILPRRLLLALAPLTWVAAGALVPVGRSRSELSTGRGEAVSA